MSNCLFCRIASNEIAAERIAENEHFFAIRDINPKYRVHILIIAKSHVATVSDISDETIASFADAWALAREVAKITKTDQSGYRLTVNNGPDAGQEIPHFHMHFLAGETLRSL